jgi:hypothetical protein
VQAARLELERAERVDAEARRAAEELEAAKRAAADTPSHVNEPSGDPDWGLPAGKSNNFKKKKGVKQSKSASTSLVAEPAPAAEPGTALVDSEPAVNQAAGAYSHL